MRPPELVGAAHQEVTVQLLNQSPPLSLVEIWRDNVLSLVDIVTLRHCKRWTCTERIDYEFEINLSYAMTSSGNAIKVL